MLLLIHFVSLANIINLARSDLYLNHQINDEVAVQEQTSREQYNVINFLGGAGPYMQFPGYGISTDIPEGCILEQVQLLGRHGERYPTPSKGAKYSEIVGKLKANGDTYQGSLRFLNTYSYDLDPSQYGLETTPENSHGLFAGTTNAKRHGKNFRKRYGSLFDSSEVLPVFSAGSNRVFNTAKAFAEGFLNISENSNQNSYKINVLSESRNSGANSLTPNLACANFDRMDVGYTTSYLQEILSRFRKENPTMDFPIVPTDILYLFDLCAYELNVKSHSDWCNVFTTSEFTHYQYFKDLGYYYGTGPGNPLSGSVGTVFLDASLKLLNQELKSKIWLSFTHDAQLDMFLSALGLFEQRDLSVEAIDFGRSYIHAHIIPQGARIYLEKFRKGGISYVRIILNDSVVPIKECYDGPGSSCGLDDFNEYVRRRLLEWDYLWECELSEDIPNELTFYWDWRAVDYSGDLVL